MNRPIRIDILMNFCSRFIEENLDFNANSDVKNTPIMYGLHIPRMFVYIMATVIIRSDPIVTCKKRLQTCMPYNVMLVDLICSPYK